MKTSKRYSESVLSKKETSQLARQLALSRKPYALKPNETRTFKGSVYQRFIIITTARTVCLL